ncbi:MAG: CapA family protein [Bacteroidales bacterium]|nr:CapA family protein [Bacteroidales bacterium]
MRKSAVLSVVLLLSASISSNAQFKFEIPSPKPLYDITDTISFFFIGDVMMHSRQMEYDHHEFLSRIAAEMREADVCVANMEFTLAGSPYTGYPKFSCPEYIPEYLVAECGADVFLTANNHILDYGSEGLSRTLDSYGHLADSAGIRFTGASRDEESMIESYPLIVEKKGLRIALINFTYGTNLWSGDEWPKVNRMKKGEIHAAFERARDKGADFIVVLPHWGTEYSLSHDDTQEKWAEWLVEEGADVIIGSHPHVVQDTTHIDGVPVIYSMGNAVSNMSVTDSRLALAVKLDFVTTFQSGCRQMLEPQLEFMWCTLPGRLVQSYATIFVKKWANRRDDWLTPSDFDNMMETWRRVKAATGIED